MISAPLFANDAQQPPEEQLDQKKTDLDDALKNSSAVPYMEDGKVKGYIVHGNDGGDQISDLHLKQGNEITIPNTDDNSEK